MRKIYFAGIFLLTLLFYSCKKEQTLTPKTANAGEELKKTDWISGAELTNGTYVFKNNNGQCFEAASTSNGAVIRQSTYTGSPIQQWDVLALGNGYYKITNHQTKLALDVPQYSKGQKVQLQQWTPNNGDNQLWYLQNQGKFYALQNKNSKLVVTLNNNSTAKFEKITQTTFVYSYANAWIPEMVNLPRITIAGTKFIDPSGKEFKAWGLNYVGNALQELMEDKWDQPAVMAAIASDFAYMKSLGTNIVRLQLQYNKYMSSPTTPNIDNIKRLLQVVEIAKQNDIYLIVTGLAAFRPADQPSWYVNTTDEQRWAMQANFWMAISTALKNNPTVFSFNLMNEPIVNSGNTAINLTNWANNGTNENSGDWFVQYITRQPYPGSTNGASNWENQMRKWIQKLTAAVRAIDQTTPITVGFLDLPPYAHFTPDLDYASPHLYIKNNASGKTSIAQYTSNKPLLIEETWPFWFQGLDANTLKTFCLENKATNSGWVSQFFGRTISYYENLKPQ
ncbi:MAG: hypothetical protein EOP47_17145, partial [Sphingobacteriaceae bacterium]